MSVLTPGWVIGLLALGAGILSWPGPPAGRHARCVLALRGNGPVRAIAIREGGGLTLATPASAWRYEDGRLDLVGPGLCGARVVFSSDGVLMAVGEESKVTIVEVTSARTKVEIPTPTGKPLALAFSPDGKTIAVAGDRGLTVRDVESGHECGPPTAADDVTGLAFSPDGRALATGDRHGAVWVWDVPGRHWLGGFRGHSFTVTTLAFSPDGHSLVTASPMDTVARIWDVATSRPLVSLRGHPAPLQAVAFETSGRVLATAGREGDVRLWEAATGRELAVLTGNDYGILTMAFSKDGRTLVAAGVGGSVWSWDVSAYGLSALNWREPRERRVY